MASDNLMAMEQQQPWMFRSTFSDAWISDIFNKETETLTKALQKSFSGTSTPSIDDIFSAELVESFLAQPDPVPTTPVQTPTISGASENDAPPPPAPKQKRNLPPSGRAPKRKSRASKRSTTTFITADPANFRQMVQQVTGIRYGGENNMPIVPVMKPEPQRAGDRLQQLMSGGPLPTFDTSSAFLMDGGASSSSLMPRTIVPPSTVVSNGGAGGGNGVGFDSFCSFPTLESWKV